MHQKPVERKADSPNYKRTDVHPLFSVVPVQQEKVSDLNGNHGGKYRSNQKEADYELAIRSLYRAVERML